MNRRHLPGNFVDNPEELFKKTRAKLKKRSSTLQQEGSSNQEDHRNLFLEFEPMANKTIREFSAPTTDNIRTGPTAEIDGNFELKPGLINMVQSNQFCGKHTKMLVLISNTFWSPHGQDQQHIHHIRSPQRCYTTSPLPILTVRESEAVVLRYKGEEYYVGTLLHELSG